MRRPGHSRPPRPTVWAWVNRCPFPPSTIWAWKIWWRRWKIWLRPARSKELDEENDEEEFSEDDEPEEDIVVNYLDRPLRLALVGRPNVGKSSLFNQLLGEDRSLVGPEAGLTRDAITAPWKAGDRDVLLHDTAGLRKKARVAGETLEEMSVASTLKPSASPIA